MSEFGVAKVPPPRRNSLVVFEGIGDLSESNLASFVRISKGPKGCAKTQAVLGVGAFGRSEPDVIDAGLHDRLRVHVTDMRRADLVHPTCPTPDERRVQVTLAERVDHSVEGQAVCVALASARWSRISRRLTLRTAWKPG